MRRTALGLLLAAVVTAAHAAGPAAFWVAPGGDDDGPGSREAPFASLERARDAARELPGRDVVITIRGGTYRLTQPLLLDERDGHAGRTLTFRAAPDETPVVSGAISVTGWEPFEGRIQRAPVGDVATRQLYVDGRRVTRARTADYPASFLPTFADPTGDVPGGGIAYVPNPVLNPLGWFDPMLWGNPGDVEAVVLLQWKMASCPVERIDPPGTDGRGLIVLREPCWTNANVFRDAKSGEPGLWSFWQVTRFENAYAFLDEAGEWYLDRAGGYLYYWPPFGENLATAAVELPVLETLVEVAGTPEQPVRNVRFAGITFTGATWLGPSGDDGYVADQSGFHLTGPGHLPNYIGHDRDVTRTPGNVRVRFASDVEFAGNVFEHLGGVALDVEPGCRRIRVTKNVFRDVSSAAIQLGGVSPDDARPASEAGVTRDNAVSGNHVYRTGRDYVDAAGIFVGFAARTAVTRNTIIDTSWSGIAIGWGWGLLDAGSFPGLPGAVSGQWGQWDTPTIARDNRIVANRIEDFLQAVWDGGAVYTTGQQGPGPKSGTLIARNVATGKRPAAGGNTFYTDGGSRYVSLVRNVSIDNPVGTLDFGACSSLLDPLPYPPLCLANGLPYGGESGGCVTYGDIRYHGNYWRDAAFFDICPYRDENGVSHPTHLSYAGNRIAETWADVPEGLVRRAGSPLFR